MPTWPTWTSDNVLSGQGLELEGQHLFNRDYAMSDGCGSTWFFANNTMTSGAFTTESTMALRVPDQMQTGGIFRCRIKTYHAGGTGNSTYRLGFHDGSSWNDGGTVTSGASASPTWTYLDLSYTLGTDEGGNFRQLRVQAQDSGVGTWTISAVAMLRNLRFEAA